MEIDSRRIRRLIRESHAKERLLDHFVRSQVWLDPWSQAVQTAVGASYDALGAPGRSIKNLMTGTKVLGHPLHPALTDVPVGAWTLGVLADWLWVATGRVPPVAGDLALAVGLAFAILAGLTGLTDFHGTVGHQRRTALVHGMTMTTVILVDLASMAFRLSLPSARPLAIVLSSIAWLVVVLGAYVGGHLAYGLGSAVNHNAFYIAGPTDFVRVGRREDFPEGEMRRRDAAGLPVVILRRQGLLYAIGAVCSHAGGPLHEGKVEEDVVTCPWHHSRFRFGDGHVVDGPATFDQPALKVRERGGIVEVKLEHLLD